MAGVDAASAHGDQKDLGSWFGFADLVGGGFAVDGVVGVQCPPEHLQLELVVGGGGGQHHRQTAAVDPADQPGGAGKGTDVTGRLLVAPRANRHGVGASWPNSRGRAGLHPSP